MLVWAGAGFVIPIVAMLTFLGLMVSLPGPEKSEFWVYGVLALSVAASGLPLGLWLNTKEKVAERGGRSHHFMFIPMQYWGALGLIAALGLFGAELFMGSSDDVAVEENPCAEAVQGLTSCLPPGASGMMQAACEASDPSIRSACASCVSGSSDPCGDCQQACHFRPTGPPPGM